MQHRTARQERLLQALSQSADAMTGTELAEHCGVTRQVVVHDIALLRASGTLILSTPRGYRLQGEPLQHRSVISVFHQPAQTELELTTLVDFGVTVVDVLVEHAIYGELRGFLQLSSRRDVAAFMEKVQTNDAVLLSSLSGGHHLHTVEAPSEERLQEAVAALRTEGIQVFD
jgi:uncharacterized protein